MTQQPVIELRAMDIANAIIGQEQSLQATHTYLAAVIKALGGHVVVKKEVFESLQDGQWEIDLATDEHGATFEVLEGSAIQNKKLGRTAGGLIVPNL